MIKNLKPGYQNLCQICSGSNLQQIISMGHTGLCDSPLSTDQLSRPEINYPLNYLRCRSCGLVQLDYVVESKELFHPAYPYRSAITDSLRTLLWGLARRMLSKTSIRPGSLVVDIGSNDGTLLEGFSREGMRVLGVEATNIAQFANEKGIETYQEFFSPDTVRRILPAHGRASLVSAANVFAHVGKFLDLMVGVHELLEDGGYFVTESHYQMDILQTLQWDSIYHEHMRFYLLKPLQFIFEHTGFTLVDVERIPNYGGSIRVVARKGRGHSINPSVASLLAEEEHQGCYSDETYKKFSQRIFDSRRQIRQTLVETATNHGPVPGIGCPGRCVTLLAFCGVGTDLMPYIAEQSSSLKLGMFTPTTHIPIVDEERLFREQPPFAMILSWHYAEAIVAAMRKKGLKSRVLVPLPFIKEI